MHRRTVAVLTVALASALAPTALAQTSTTSTSSTSSTSSSSTSRTSTSTSTTSTTFPNPCAGQPCTERPPDAFLAGANGEVRLDRESFCWTDPTPNAQGFLRTVCGDVLARDPDARLAVTPGETLTLRFATAATPTQVILERDDTGRDLTPGNPVRFTVDFPAGSSPIVRFFTRWLQGDMSYAVRLDVRSTAPPANPRRGVVSLTG